MIVTGQYERTEERTEGVPCEERFGGHDWWPSDRGDTRWTCRVCGAGA